MLAVVVLLPRSSLHAALHPVRRSSRGRFASSGARTIAWADGPAVATHPGHSDIPTHRRHDQELSLVRRLTLKGCELALSLTVTAGAAGRRNLLISRQPSRSLALASVGGLVAFCRMCCRPSLLLLLLLLLCLHRRCGTAAEGGAATSDAAGLMAQTCTFKGQSVHPQRCSGLRHCKAWNGHYGPQSGALDCSRAEAEAVASVQGLFLGVDSTEVHTACWEALMTLHCARVFGQMQCEGSAELGLGTRPCSSACERINADCAEHTSAQIGSGALTCTAEMGYDTDPSNCAPLPRQDQLVLAAQHGLSPLAVDFIQLWESDEERYDDTFLTSTHHTSRSEMKGWSFYTNGPRWFDPTWFGLVCSSILR